MKAEKRVDIEASLLKGRKIPCICPREEPTRPLSYSHSRGVRIECIECEACLDRWRRFDHS